MARTSTTGRPNKGGYDVSANAWNAHVADYVSQSDVVAQTMAGVIDLKEASTVNSNAFQIMVPYNAKIADITHTDVNKHFLDLAAALTETRTIVAVGLIVERIGGTGAFSFYPNEGAKDTYVNDYRWLQWIVIAAGTNRMQYNLTVANDDWDMWCLGYVVEV